MKIKIFGLFLSSFLFTLNSSAQEGTIEVDGKQQLSLFFHRTAPAAVTLKNKSAQGVKVEVLHRLSGAFVRGFGLSGHGKATVSVGIQEELLLRNTNIRKAKIAYSATESNQPLVAAETISFQLFNSSTEAIPLWIPGVMNPRLSPNSKSAVRLKIGQPIYYKIKGKKRLLFEVDAAINSGAIIDVPQRIELLSKE